MVLEFVPCYLDSGVQCNATPMIALMPFLSTWPNQFHRLSLKYVILRGDCEKVIIRDGQIKCRNRVWKGICCNPNPADIYLYTDHRFCMWNPNVAY